MIFDKRRKIESDEIDEFGTLITVLDEWIQHCSNELTRILLLCGVNVYFDFEDHDVDESNKPANKPGMSQTKDTDDPWAPFDRAMDQVKWTGENSQRLETLIEWSAKLERARKAKKQVKKKIQVTRENFQPKQDMFHKWGYTKTNSQNVQHKHNPFKIN